MNLKDLQAMIKEELDTYMNEEEVDVDVDMAAGDIDADGAEEGDKDEDILMQIYNMLKDKFEGEEEAEDNMDNMDDMDDMDKDMDEDMYENTNVHTQLQERFKKLANIIK